MLTSPMASNSVNSWPTLASRPKENPFFAQSDSSPFKSLHCEPNGSVGDRGESGMNSKTKHDHSDDESIDFAINDLETTYARPEFNESFGTAIAEALNKAAHSKNPRKQQIEMATGRNGGGGGKKKKNTRQTILFSTGSSRTFDGK